MREGVIIHFFFSWGRGARCLCVFFGPACRRSSTHRLVKALLLLQHLAQRLEDFDAQLLLLVHELLGVFNQPDRVTSGAITSMTVTPLLMRPLAPKPKTK